MFTTLDFWIRNEGDKATLDRLFQFMETVDLFAALKETLNKRLKSQNPRKGECVFLIILVVVVILIISFSGHCSLSSCSTVSCC